MTKNPHVFCELRSLGGCSGGLQWHHIIKRSAFRNVPGALAYCEKWSEVLIADICEAHHIGGIANSKENRASLLKVRCSIFGVEYVSGVLDGLCALYKVPPTQWRLSALLAA